MGAEYTKRGRWIVLCFSVFTVANLVSLVIGLVNLGGDAASGCVDGDQYFVGYRGTFTEVTRAQWICIYAHFLLFSANVLGGVVMGIVALLVPQCGILIDRR